MVSFSTLSLLCFSAFVKGQRDTIDIFIDFDFAGMQVLDVLLNDTVIFNQILDHGCWCSKLDPTADTGKLGGATALDELDDICRQWFTTRHCNDGLLGGSCKNAPTPDHYELDYTNDPAICNTVDQDTSQAITTCAHDSCLIDVLYTEMMIDWLGLNPGWSSLEVDDFDTCMLPELGDFVKTCVGIPPHVSIHVDGSTPIVQAANTAEAAEICQDAIFDLTVLVDGSGSVASANYVKSVDFVEDMIAPLNIGVNNTRITLAQFSAVVTVYTTYDADPASVQTHLNTLRGDQDRSNTQTGLALQTMYDTINDFGRDGVPQVFVIITDGVSTNGLIYPHNDPSGVDTAAQLINHPVTSYAIGVGSGTSLAELQAIASNPDEEHMFDLDGFNSLDQIKLALTSGVCQSEGDSSGGDGGTQSAPAPPSGTQVFGTQSAATGVEFDSSGNCVDIGEGDC